MTESAIEMNGQLTFLAELKITPAVADGSRIRTWILLIGVMGSEVRSELSLPTRFEGQVPTEYVERLILPIIDLDDQDRHEGPSEGEDFDVDISRRSA
ncbi:MAG: hypothetical protein GEU90_03215 [Gemmatimonas sp.]|nr:hypothetical protein [Gemmatimonas sp.]